MPDVTPKNPGATKQLFDLFQMNILQIPYFLF